MMIVSAYILCVENLALLKCKIIISVILVEFHFASGFEALVATFVELNSGP